MARTALILLATISTVTIGCIPGISKLPMMSGQGIRMNRLPPTDPSVSLKTDPLAGHGAISAPSEIMNSQIRAIEDLDEIECEPHVTLASDSSPIIKDPSIIPAQAIAPEPPNTDMENGEKGIAETESTPTELSPIDLSNALGLAGANHLQIRLARERVVEAQANFVAAKALWLPSIRFGVGWNKHDGRLQQTEGDVLEVSRNSLFVGGGLGLGQVPLAGGSNGPFRLAVNLSLADAIFQPRVAACQLASRRAEINHVFNDSLLDVSQAYYDLVEAYSELANAKVAASATSDLVQLTTLFANEGAGTTAEVDRAKTAESLQKQSIAIANRNIAVSSARLVRLLRLDPNSRLAPVEDQIVPVAMLETSIGLYNLIQQGLASRPELSASRAWMNATGHTAALEQWRPWLPNVQVGASAGSFGGGPSSTFDNQADRSDIDLLAVWEMQNLGYGNRAARSRTFSQWRQTQLVYQQIADTIAEEVAAAFHEIRSLQVEMESTMQAAKTAQDSFDKNLKRVQEGEGLPIELLQAVSALNDSLNAYTTSVASFNRAQFRLLRAIGKPRSDG